MAVLACLLLRGGDGSAWAAQSQEKPVVLCITRQGLEFYQDPRKVIKIFNELVYQRMVPELGFPIEFKYYDTDNDMYAAFRRGQADVGCGRLVKFLENYSKGLVEPIIWYYREGAEGDYYCLFIHSKSKVKTRGQLRGRVLGYSDPEDVAKIRDVFFSHMAKSELKQYFKGMILYRNSRAAILSLSPRQTDVVFDSRYAMDVLQRTFPQIRGFKELVRSETIPDLPMFKRAKTSEEIDHKIDKIKEYFMTMHEDPGLLMMLQLLGCDEAREIQPEQERVYRIWIKKYRKMGLIP